MHESMIPWLKHKANSEESAGYVHTAGCIRQAIKEYEDLKAEVATLQAERDDMADAHVQRERTSRKAFLERLGKLEAEVGTLKTENETLKKRIAELTSYLDELGY